MHACMSCLVMWCCCCRNGRLCCRDDVQVITANPKTAGVARWNFLALWGHRLKQGDAAALDYVTKVRSGLL